MGHARFGPLAIENQRSGATNFCGSVEGRAAEPSHTWTVLVAASWATERFEIFPGKKACRRDVGDDATWAGEPYCEVSKEAIQVRVAVEAPSVPCAHVRRQRNPAVWRIPNYQIMVCLPFFWFRGGAAIANIDEDWEPVIDAITPWH